MTDAYLRREQRNVYILLETESDVTVKFRPIGVTLFEVRWMVGHELTIESTTNGSHIMLQGITIATVESTTIKAIFYPTAANHAARKLAKEEQGNV